VVGGGRLNEDRKKTGRIEADLLKKLSLLWRNQKSRKTGKSARTGQ
jgi:hypothetical protein